MDVLKQDFATWRKQPEELLISEKLGEPRHHRPCYWPRQRRGYKYWQVKVSLKQYDKWIVLITIDQLCSHTVICHCAMGALFVSQDINQVTEEQLNTWTPTWKRNKIMEASQMIWSELVDVPVCFSRCQKSNFTFASSGLTHTAVRMRVGALHTMWMKWRTASFWLWWSMMRDPTTWRNLPRRASQVWAASTSAALDSGELQKYCIVFLPVVEKMYCVFSFNSQIE